MRRMFVTRDLASFVNRGLAVVPAVLEAAPVTLLLAAGAAPAFWLGEVVNLLTQHTLHGTWGFG